jgi:hypothetical protein
MGGFSIQFYALPGELANFIEQTQATFNFYIVKTEFNPFKAILVSPHNDVYLKKGLPAKNFICYNYKPTVSFKGQNEFLDANPSGLHLDVGTLDGNVLSQSWLFIDTNNIAILAVAKNVAAMLKK